MEVWPDLFGRALLVRQWGRIGTEGRRRLDGGAGETRSRHVPPFPAQQVGMQLHTADGTRKYLTAGERDSFLREAERADRAVRTLCLTLAYAGCRLSEALR